MDCLTVSLLAVMAVTVGTTPFAVADSGQTATQFDAQDLNAGAQQGTVQNGGQSVKPADGQQGTADSAASDSTCDAVAAHSMPQQGLRNTNC